MQQLYNVVFLLIFVFVGALGQNSQGDGNSFLTMTTLQENDNISRPCPFYDSTCIRKFLAAHSKCKIAKEGVPDPYFRTESNFYYPFFNMSASQVGVYYGNVRGRVEEFFVDRENNQLLIQIRFINSTVNSTLDVYRFQRDGKEPAVTLSDSFAVFPSFSVTTIFKDVNHLDLGKSETIGFIDALPTTFILNPSAGVSPDPAVAPMFANFISNPRVVVQEAVLTGASFFAGLYIQYSLCDFGLEIY